MQHGAVQLCPVGVCSSLTELQTSATAACASRAAVGHRSKLPPVPAPFQCCPKRCACRRSGRAAVGQAVRVTVALCCWAQVTLPGAPVCAPCSRIRLGHSILCVQAGLCCCHPPSASWLLCSGCGQTGGDFQAPAVRAAIIHSKGHGRKHLQVMLVVPTARVGRFYRD